MGRLLNYKKASTGRLLNMYRNLRQSVFLNYYWGDETEDTVYNTLEEMKKELDTREHVPRKHEKKKKKNLPYSRR